MILTVFHDNVTAFFLKSSENRRDFAKKWKNVGGDRSDRMDRANKNIMCRCGAKRCFSPPLGREKSTKSVKNEESGLDFPEIGFILLDTLKQKP